MRRALPVVAAVVIAAAAVAGSWYGGRTTAPAAADVVTQPAATAPLAAAGSPTEAAEMRACTLGLDLAIDAGLSWDSNSALEDAYDLGDLTDRLPAGSLRDSAEELARQIPRLVGPPQDLGESWGDAEDLTSQIPGAVQMPEITPDQSVDDPTEQITELLWDLRQACDSRFLGRLDPAPDSTEPKA